jgi:hypothetical protein
MKKFITTSAVLIALALSTTGAFAANKTKTTKSDGQVFAALTYYDNSCNVDVVLDKLTPGNSTLRIYDEDGNVIFKDDVAINAETIKKSYLLTDLADGDYTIEVTTNNNEVIEQDLTLSSQESDEQIYSF